MKKFLYMLVLFAGVFVWNSCEEDIPEIRQLPVADPISLDEAAGDWKPVFVNTLPTISAPATVNSQEYQAELQALQDLTASRTNEQESKAKFWAGGGVLQWNKIARDLVVRYNKAPNVTDPPTPADPNKPFTNPPFASRVYALLSVAQHDALIAAWHFKFLHNRPAPAKSNTAIKLLTPETDLPSYPSEQAVIAQASYRILEFLFPAKSDSTDFLSKATEHMNSAMWAGASTQSDIDAGKIIGDYVATRIINRAKIDRMSQASDPNKTYIAYFGLEGKPNPWKSLEIPARPPMLPLFGKVKPWFDSLAVFAFMPPPPPEFGSPAFLKDLNEVRSIADDRSRTQWSTGDFWADGAGTTTPPGHWNIIAEDLTVEARYSEVRTARVFSLMNRAIMDAGIVCWYAKYKHFIPRPSQMDAEIKTATGIPNFPSYTSGHSSFSGAAAILLGHLFPAHKSDLIAKAEEAAISRLYAGIHYRFDNEAGYDTGAQVGQLAIENAIDDGAD